MQALTLYQVDAFTKELFKGNPAAVVRLRSFLPNDLMQDLAAENNLSETAFIVPQDKPGHYDLRWFTPRVEINFCGHATVATAHVLAAEYGETPPFHFHTKIGELVVTKDKDLYVMDAPKFSIIGIDVSDAMRKAFPVPINAAFLAADNLYVVFENADDVRLVKPDMTLVKPLSEHGVGITARGRGEYDCVSRLFFPAIDLAEDPVTGSAHAAIGPYWANILSKNKLTAYQASERGGVLYLNVGETRMTISGHAVTYMKGQFYVPDVNS